MKDALGAVQSVLILGGSSDIGVAIATRLAGPRQAKVVLAGRHQEALDAAAARVRAAGASQVSTLAFDALDPADHEAVVTKAADILGDIDVVVLAFGLLEGDPVLLAQTNYVGAVSAGLAAAETLRRQGHGTLVFMSSVAGERVRKANFVYGSTKAGLDGFAQGLGDDLAGSGVSVLVVRPGFVTSKMTEGKDAAPMATTPEAVADATAKAIASGKETVWVPGTLRVVFAGFRHLPRAAWRRMPM
ncbi:MAG: decaprenylphospho-beta-D-erythro-pentofuranosid-2-ulose 2-reductase [Acidimicrobiaceae bacterium]|nr:decaprenylphospho-beta-D-erythro-pentofuranosid-2-ulose 2-reductase [Acidimicrobiaceae bacterium]